jgi:hypothetical protein
METDAPNTEGAGGDLLPYLERLWRIPAKAPAHDPQRFGWLIAVWVFAFIATGSALGAIATASVAPLLATGASGLVSVVVVGLHQHARRRRRARWH